MYVLCGTVEPRFNEVVGGLVNLFVKSRVRYIEYLDITKFKGKRPKCSLYLRVIND